MKAQAKEAKKLSKLLGEDHDLAVLADVLRTIPTLDGDELLPLIAKRRAELLKRSRKLGRRIYAERPKAFARRVAPLRGTGRARHGGRAQVRARRAARTGSATHRSQRLEQGYLAIDPAGAEVRVRRKDDETLMTVKTGDRAGARRGGVRDRRRPLRRGCGR